MIDGYIQTKQRDLDNKINKLLERLSIVEQKIDNIDKKYHDYDQLLSELKQETKQHQNIKIELEKSTEKTIEDMIPKVREKLDKQVEKKLKKQKSYVDAEINVIREKSIEMLEEIKPISRLVYQMTILTWILYQQGILDIKDVKNIEKLKKIPIKQNKEMTNLITQIKKDWVNKEK